MARVGSKFKKIIEEAQQHPAYWMEDLRLQFLEGISAIMESQGITQKELAEKMGVSEAYISKVFNDNVEKNFTLKTLVEICKAVDAEIKIIVTSKKRENLIGFIGRNGLSFCNLLITLMMMKTLPTMKL